jgi:ribose transport system permease protein
MAQQVPHGLGAPIGGQRAGGEVWNTALRWVSRNARILAPLTTLVVMFVFFSVVTDVFLTTQNLKNVVSQVGPVGVAAAGITFVLLCAEIDLSIASVATYAGMLATYYWIGGDINLIFTTLEVDMGNWALPFAVAIATLIGLINGLLVAYVGIPSFMMTLAMLTIASGLAVFLNKGQAIYEVPEITKDIASVRTIFLGIPVIGWVALGVLVVGEIVLQFTRFGRYVFMTGGNREAAELSGVDTRRVVMLCLTICGFCAGLAGLLAAGRLGSANPTANETLLINTIAAVVLGGTSLFGGEGGMKNTLLGLLIFGILSNGLNLLPDISIHFKQALQGIILVGALLLNVFALRLERIRTRAE